MEVRATEEGESEGRPVIGWILVAPAGSATSPDCELNIPAILGQAAITSFFHPRGSGNCLIAEVQTATNDTDFDWFWAKKVKAHQFVRLLQYFKDGVVHVGYTTALYGPSWVNQFRQSGLFAMSSPRQAAYENGARIYKIANDEAEKIGLWWRRMTSPPISDLLQSTNGKFRQAIYWNEKTRRRQNHGPFACCSFRMRL